MERDYKDKLCKDIEGLYQGSQFERNLLEKNMNKKLSDIRMKYIEEINNGMKGDGLENKNVANRFLLEEKQIQISNKEELIKTL